MSTAVSHAKELDVQRTKIEDARARGKIVQLPLNVANEKLAALRSRIRAKCAKGTPQQPGQTAHTQPPSAPEEDSLPSSHAGV